MQVVLDCLVEARIVARRHRSQAQNVWDVEAIDLGLLEVAVVRRHVHPHKVRACATTRRVAQPHLTRQVDTAESKNLGARQPRSLFPRRRRLHLDQLSA